MSAAMDPEAKMRRDGARDRTAAGRPSPPPRSGEVRDPVVLPIFDPRQWTTPAPLRLWNVPDWIPQAVVTALYGDGGIGKSLMAQMLLTCTALGLPWCGLAVNAGRALGIFCEDDPDELHRRQEAINRSLGVSMADLGNMRLLSRLGQDNAMVRFDQSAGSLSNFQADVLKTCKDWRPDLLALDTAADLYPDNENDRGKVRWFVQVGLGSIAREIGCGLLLLAHPSVSGLANGTGSGGSTAWNNTVRSRLYLERETGDAADPNGRLLSRKKANYSATEGVIRLTWREGVLAVNNAAGATSTLTWPTVTAMFDEIERAWRDGPSWSFSAQTRKAGRYFPKWCSDHLGVPMPRTEALLADWQMNRFLALDTRDAKTKERGLRVLRRPDPPPASGQDH